MIAPLNTVTDCRTAAPLHDDGYRWRYIAVWGVGWLLLLAAIAGLVIGIVLSTFAVAFPLMAVCLLVFALMYRDAARLRYRAGSGLLGGLCGERGSFAPRTMDELIAACDTARRSGDRLSVVGSAWSNTLGQRTVRGRRLYMHRAVGRLGNARTWLAGTPLKQIQRELAAEDPSVQLVGVPGSSYVTIGAWIATLGHGNSGPAATHGLVIASAKVYDQATGLSMDMSPLKVMEAFGKGPGLAAQYVVLSVTAEEGIYENITVKRQGAQLVNLTDANWALDKRSVMRAVFIGNTKTLALRWIPHTGTELAESTVLKVWLFVFAALGWGSAMPYYKGKDSTGRLSDEVYLFPDALTPPQLWSQMILNIVNYELYTKDITLDASTLLQISDRLQRIHSEHGGRTELRTLGKYVFFDMAMWANTNAFRDAFAALHELGVNKCAQHPGKYVHTKETAACGGVRLVSVKEL